LSIGDGGTSTWRGTTGTGFRVIGFVVALAGFGAEDGFVDGGGDVTLVTLVGDATGSTVGAVGGGGGGSTGTGVGGVVAEVVVVVP